MNKPTHDRAPHIVIVGAGAMGILAGYHLGLGGAQMAYLVRPARAARLPSAVNLYSYDNARIHRFGGYAVITDLARIAELRPDFVVVTLDGAALTGAEGMGLLSAIGTAVRAHGARSRHSTKFTFL